MPELPSITPVRLPGVHRLAPVMAEASHPLHAPAWLEPDADQFNDGRVDMLKDETAEAQ